jgi:hypothetical protein
MEHLAERWSWVTWASPKDTTSQWEIPVAVGERVVLGPIPVRCLPDKLHLCIEGADDEGVLLEGTIVPYLGPVPPSERGFVILAPVRRSGEPTIYCLIREWDPLDQDDGDCLFSQDDIQ